MVRREIAFSYSHDDLLKRLDLPKDAVILSMYTQTFGTNARLFCFKISTHEKDLDKYIEKETTLKRKARGESDG